METILNQFEGNPYLMPAIIVAGTLILGYIFQNLIIRKLKSISEKTEWKGDDVIIGAMGKAPILWFLLVGVYAAMFDIPIEEFYKTLLWQLILIVVVVSISLVFSRIVTGFIKIYAEKSHGALPSTSMFNVLTKLTIYVIGGLIVMQTLGISITPLLTALGVGGLAVALALQETLSNLFAGLHIIASRKIRPGDFIEIEGGQSGYVQDVSWRNTSIRTLGNNLVIIPNSSVASATIINYEGPQREMSVLIQCGVAYGSDLDKVEKLVIEEGIKTLKKVKGAVADYTPLVRFHTFGESSVDLLSFSASKSL